VAPGGDRPGRLDAAPADADIPVVEVHGRVAVAGDQAELVAEREAVSGGGDRKAAVLVGGALVGGGGLVADERRARVEGERLEADGDDSAVRGRTSAPAEVGGHPGGGLTLQSGCPPGSAFQNMILSKKMVWV